MCRVCGGRHTECACYNRLGDTSAAGTNFDVEACVSVSNRVYLLHSQGMPGDRGVVRNGRSIAEMARHVPGHGGGSMPPVESNSVGLLQTQARRR
jgi:hypothetical protein